MKRLGIFFGWDQHRSTITSPDRFMRVAFGDNPWVMADAEIWFSTLWHFDTPDTWIDWANKTKKYGGSYGAVPQNGFAAVERVLQRTDQTDKRIWLTLCFDFNDPEQWTRYGELLDRIKNHSSLYTMGICTDEWVNYPDDPDVAKQRFLEFRDLVRSKGKLASGHLFFAGGPAQGNIPDGVPFLIQNYDLIFLHNNYPHYDNLNSNLRVMSGMLNRQAYQGAGLVGGSQGYFTGATTGPGMYRQPLPSQSNYWISEDFYNVIEDYERVNDPSNAQILFVAMNSVDEQWAERETLHPTMKNFGGWLIEDTDGGDETPYNPSDAPHVTVTVTEGFRSSTLSVDETSLSGVAPYTAIIRGTLSDTQNGDPIEGRQIDLQIDGVPVLSATTNSNGRYEFQYLFSGPGVYDAFARFAGDTP